MINITSDKGLDCLTNSPHHYHRKCMENRMENIHADIRVLMAMEMKVVTHLYPGSTVRRVEFQKFFIQLTTAVKLAQLFRNQRNEDTEMK